MKLKIEITIDNAAFHDNDGTPAPHHELSRMLSCYAELLSEGENIRYTFKDINGNTVGHTELEEH